MIYNVYIYIYIYTIVLRLKTVLRLRKRACTVRRSFVVHLTREKVRNREKDDVISRIILCLIVSRFHEKLRQSKHELLDSFSISNVLLRIIVP